MTEFWVLASSIVLGVAAGVAGSLFARKWLPGGEAAASGDGSMLRTLIDNLPDLIYVKDVDGRFLLAEIADSSREQASGIEQVNRTVTSMDAVTQQNAALVEEATAAARALSEQATGLMS
jgi:methyl-accepting chemotaxis protein